ncbi:hypothetical protein D6_00105 [Faustovirus]|nr:hypothetical protein D6_00105 [Faustovirus]AMP44344.1 hypothetical protein PRJ_Dakar_00392 [Faustovirus]
MLVLCNNDQFMFLATYDHKGYYGTLSTPNAKRAVSQEPYGDTPYGDTPYGDTPITAPTSTPIAPSICSLTDISNVDLEILTIELDMGIKGFTNGGVYNESVFNMSHEKAFGSFYKYGKIIFNAIQPLYSNMPDTSRLTSSYKFVGMLSDGEYTLYQLPSMFASNSIVTAVGFANAMFRTWQTETQLVI